jgi:hypothetical protein
MMFRVKLLRSLVIEGRRWMPGAQLQADAAGAAELVLGGVAVLVDDADLPRLIEALPPQAPHRRAAPAA